MRVCARCPLTPACKPSHVRNDCGGKYINLAGMTVNNPEEWASMIGHDMPSAFHGDRLKTLAPN